MEADVLPRLVGGDQHLPLFIPPGARLHSSFKAGTDIRDSLGQIPDLTGGEAKDSRKEQTYLRSLVQ